MLDFNTVLYDDVDNKWQFDRVNDSSVTCYIKFSKNRITYLQSIANFNDKDIDKVEIDQIIIKESMIYSSPKQIERILKNISHGTL